MKEMMAATIWIGKKRIVTSIDGHTFIRYFSGGDLGKLAITGR